MSNDVYDAWGNLIGFRCHICDEVKTKMWGCVCNLCRAKGYDKSDAEVK